MSDARVSVLIDLRSKLAGLEAVAQGFSGLIKLAAGFATAYISVRSVVAGARDIIELGAELPSRLVGVCAKRFLNLNA